MIWILGDQHRGQALGCAGDPNVHTPNLDALAANGIRFEHALTNCPLCSPARGTLLTSRYAHECVPGHEHPLPTGIGTVAHAFNQAGYSTAYFGKWHLDGFKEKDGRGAHHLIPADRRGGFATWIGYENNNCQGDCWVHGGTGPGLDDVPLYRLPGYETDSVTDLLLQHLGKSTRPFFAVLSVQPPHDPYVAPEDFMRRHTPGGVVLRANVPQVPSVLAKCRRELAGYYAMIENLDWNVGRVRAELRRLELDRNTLIVFFSDHGDMHGSHGQFLKHLPYQESVGVPLIIGGADPYALRPGYVGGRVTRPVSLIDLAPTTLGLCGIAVPSAMRGCDYSAHVLKSREFGPEPDSVYIQYPQPFGLVDSSDSSWRGVVTADGWKYVEYREQPWLMFNLNEDPYEQVNLAILPRCHGTRRRLRERLARRRTEVDDTWPVRSVEC